jgi:glycine/D-amino acid oxidase-like deaminating enzyme
MRNIYRQEFSAVNYDVVICGGGIAGLWLLNVLVTAGYSVLLVEKSAIGGVQTMASQGMIHGGQRYLLGANSSTHARSVAPLPERWNACLEGRGELDLRGVRILSETQLMWSVGGRIANLTLSAATHVVKAKMRKIATQEIPDALAGLSGNAIYELPEKVLDTASLVEVLSAPHHPCIKQGSVDSLTREGTITVSGVHIAAQIIICAAGQGNEELLALVDAGARRSQRRPIRQVMVKPIPFPLYGHAVAKSYKPRVTVTSQPLPSGDYVWYLGGALADQVLSLTEDQAISYAQKEMKALFHNIEWSGKQWATWFGVRAEGYNRNGILPNGPVLQEYGDVFFVWPTKLTLAPLLGDQVLERLAQRGVTPRYCGPSSLSSNLTLPARAPLPWDMACWAG